jgi:hypothetical protein
MNRNTQTAARLREVLLNGHWIANTNYREQLLGIDWETATRKVGDLNSIAALTFHINYYLSGLIAAFTSGKLEISDKFSFDLPPISSQEDWNSLVSEFIENSIEFCRIVEELDEELLDQPFINENYGSYLRNIEGVIEHSYYHLGQMTLINKLVNSAHFNL